MSKTLEEISGMNDEEKLLHRDYTDDLETHDQAIENYDALEAMDAGMTYDTESKKTSNGLTDNMTATIYIERAARVAGQLPDGETVAIGKKDMGKAMFYDLLRTNWIYENANSQFDFLTKMYLWQYSSSVYNVVPMHYDLTVNESTGYYGPDCWLWNPRNFVPQAGITSVTDMDYAHAITYKTKGWFQDILDDKDDDYDLDAIKEIMDKLDSVEKEADEKRDTMSYRDKIKTTTKQVEVVTRYESGEDGRWVTFLPDYSYTVIRNIENPHKNGRIPFVLKRCLPRLDSYYGNGDFARSMPMQFANDGLDNFYFQGIKVNMFPIHMINMQSAVKNTIQNKAGAIWQFNGPPDARRMETSTAGLSTYQAAKGMTKGAIQTAAGTTDTRSNAESSSDPGFGKTPQALRMMSERESTRDNLDRGFLERAMAELIDGMFSILPTMSEDIPVDLFQKEIDQMIESGHTDVIEIIDMWSEKEDLTYDVSESEDLLRMKIKPGAFKNISAHFKLKPNSTSKQTREEQLQSVIDFWTFIGKMPNALDQYQENTGKVPDWEFVFKEMGDMMDLPFMAKMFTEAAPQPATPPGEEPMPQGPEGMMPPEQGMMPPEAMPPQMPEQGGEMPMPEMGMPPQDLPSEIPEEFLIVSPANPITIAGHKFTDPELAWEAYKQYVTITGQEPQ